MMKHDAERNALLEALEKMLLPQAQQHGMAKIWMTPPRWESTLSPPAGMSVQPCPLRGARVAQRGQRAYGSSVVEARWPQDGLAATRTPKIFFVLEGDVVLRVADYKVHIKPGCGLLVPAGTPFSHGVPRCCEEEQAPKSCALLMLLPYHDGLLCWIAHQRLDARRRLHESEETVSIPLSGVSFYLDLLVSEARNRDLHHRLVCDALWQLALAILHRELQRLPVFRTGAHPLAKKPTANTRGEHFIAQAQRYIHQHLREKLSIGRVARAVCLSRTVFTAQFRARTGHSFAQYVTEARFAQAEKILLETDLAVEQVASLVGFKPARMRALFQQRKGLSPQRFRAQSRPGHSEK